VADSEWQNSMSFEVNTYRQQCLNKLPTWCGKRVDVFVGLSTNMVMKRESRPCIVKRVFGVSSLEVETSFRTVDEVM
jgi:hypothetical protein